MKARTALTQPLVTRPAYGGRERTVAESGLPEGGPSSKGLPLDSGIPGSRTFVSPDGDTEDNTPKDESIYRVDGPKSLPKDQSRIEVNEDNANKHDGIGGWGKGDWDERSPKPKYPYRDGIPNEKSAYVVASWLADTAPVLHLTPGMRVALRLDPIMQGLNPKYLQRAKSCSVSLSRFDKKNLRWTFSVDCGNGPKVVKIKAFRKGNITRMSKLELDITCSCKAWRWQGPEHWSQGEDYLLGDPRGTASFPIIRDPSGINRVCKHVAACLNHVKKWEIPA